VGGIAFVGPTLYATHGRTGTSRRAREVAAADAADRAVVAAPHAGTAAPVAAHDSARTVGAGVR